MGIFKDLYEKLNRNAVHNGDQERMPYDEQVSYLSSFPEPKDDYERSYFKFKCFCEYCYYKKKWIIASYNAGAMALLPIMHRRLRKAWKNRDKAVEKVDAVIENVPKLPCDDVIPQELRDSYKTVKEIHAINYSDAWLSDEAEEIVKELERRYPTKFYFRIITMMKLAQFCQYLDKYKPEAILFYSCEREFAGPLQTKLCEKMGSKYISYMHGDYLSTLCFAFQKFSHYYIWDESYRSMFEQLKWSAPMTVYKPAKLKGIAEPVPDGECKYYATYYFSDETREQIAKIYEVFSALEKRGLKTKVRPHPRFSDVEAISSVFKDIEIEDTKEWSLAKSISESEYIVGLNTTVLSEAYFSGKKIAIDDVSDPAKYSELDKRGYISIRRPHVLLSELGKERAEQ